MLFRRLGGIRFLPAVVLAICAVLFGAIDSFAFGLKPVIVKVEMRRGARGVTELSLFATRERPEKVRLYFTWYTYQRDGQLDLSELTEQQIRDENLPVLELSDYDVELRPQQEVTVRMTVSVPSRAAQNEYVFALIVEAVDDDLIRRPGQPTVGLRQRVAVPVIINIPGRTDRFAARVTTVSGEMKEDGYYIVASMENTGNRYVDASGIARIRDASGRIVHTMPLIAVSVGAAQRLGVISILPGGVRDFVAKVAYPLTAGTYTVEIIGHIRQNDRLRLTSRAEIAIPRDLAEELAEVQPLQVVPGEFELKLKPQGSSAERLEIANIYIDSLEIEVSSDSPYIQTSSIPLRIAVGATESVLFKVQAPVSEDLRANLIIKVRDRDFELKVPVSVILQKEM